MADYTFCRRELKYLVSDRQRRFIEDALKAHMTPDIHAESGVANIYYDTPDWRLIRASLEKPVYKEKLRLRAYGGDSSGTAFLELKKKYKGIVYKRRIEISEDEAARCIVRGEPLPRGGQIGREIDYFIAHYPGLKPSVYLGYERAAYSGREDNGLRITFDNNIRFRTGALTLSGKGETRQLLDRGQSLMEIKAAFAMPLWLTALLDEGGIKQSSFSKYGRAYETLLSDTIINKRGVNCA